MKQEILRQLESVCKTLDGGITVSGAQNAGNLAGCFVILRDMAALLSTCEIISKENNEENG